MPIADPATAQPSAVMTPAAPDDRSPPRRRRGLVLGFVILDVWLFGYVIASARGGYWLRPESADVQLAGVDVPTMVRWQPRPGFASSERRDLLGWIWAPLIALDRSVWHRDLDLATQDGRARLKQAFDDSHIHPDDPVHETVRELLE